MPCSSDEYGSWDAVFVADMVAQLREQVKICLMKKREGPEVDETVDKLRQVIESNQTNALRLCTEKVLLAQQVFDLVATSSPSLF